jgi:hypothetical protein
MALIDADYIAKSITEFRSFDIRSALSIFRIDLAIVDEPK